jgi:hypothetical protein
MGAFCHPGCDVVLHVAEALSATVDGMPPFLAADNLKRFISDELRQSTTPIFFRNEK